MATKYRMGEEVVKLFNQTVLGGNITVQEAMLVASQAANKYIREYIFANKSAGEQTVPYSCLKEYIEPVLTDGNGKFYASLPVRTLEGLPNNGGIFQVSPANDESELIAPLNTGFFGMFKGLDSYQLEGRIGYIPKLDKIYLYGVDTITDGYSLKIVVVPDSTALDAADEMPLPTDCEYDVITMAVQMAQTKMASQPNIVTDNTPK